jgi:hypothetical protein
VTWNPYPKPPVNKKQAAAPRPTNQPSVHFYPGVSATPWERWLAPLKPHPRRRRSGRITSPATDGRSLGSSAAVYHGNSPGGESRRGLIHGASTRSDGRGDGFGELPLDRPARGRHVPMAAAGRRSSGRPAATRRWRRRPAATRRRRRERRARTGASMPRAGARPPRPTTTRGGCPGTAAANAAAVSAAARRQR